MDRTFHVSLKGHDCSEGSFENPFRTISKAASLAEAGDKIIVHEGVYREWVKPNYGGTSSFNRIVYEAAEGEKAVIKGSEIIKGWEKVEGTVWKVSIENSFFGDYNPYTQKICGDWLIKPDEYDIHTGDVYLNGHSFYEAASLNDVKAPQKRFISDYRPAWTCRDEPVEDPEFSVYQWYAQVDESRTEIYANFHGFDPNKETVEINVRKCCFYPDKTGIDYITVRGFEIAHAACPFAPPTADQPGMVGPHWSKGWIIENNILHDAKCSAISLGKEASTGDNDHYRHLQKPGYQYQMEAVFLAYRNGWSKSTIGSHIVRNNKIYDCGQNGIVGHMGCIFSEIYNNEIHNIGMKHEFFGHEIAGIKLHAAIDTQIHNNHIYNCSLGTWLDWQAQGIRVSSNLYHDNVRDLFIEVSHGPYIVDNNIFASEYCFDNASQGGAYINNLCFGSFRRIKILDRSTPYHYAHTTDIAGTALIHSGDDRLYNNIFLGGMDIVADDSSTGTSTYNIFHDSYESYIAAIKALGRADHTKYFQTEQPVYINDNAYFKKAEHFDREKELCDMPDFDPKAKIVSEEDGIYLEITLPEEFFSLPCRIHSTETLGKVRMADLYFDDPSGNPVSIDKDFFGNPRPDKPSAGPIEGLKPGFNKVKLI